MKGCAALASGIWLVIVTSAAAQTHVYKTAAVACDHSVASEAGAEILRLGGNAVDAAVAASFVLSVVRPDSCGIGGGGFMVVYRPPRDGQPAVQLALDFRETAPAAVGPEYLAELRARTGAETLSRYGPHAVATPGAVAGLLWALEHHGKLDRAAVLAPAIRAAEDGFLADAHHEAAGRELLKKADGETYWQFASFPWETVERFGQARAGERLTNPEQARVLRLIAERGRAGFYAGEVADAIVATIKAFDGPLRHSDLTAYQPRVRAPLRGEFRGRTILAMPPPSSGGVALLQIFGILERRLGDLEKIEHNSAPYVHLLAEATKHAFADRARWLADPAFAAVPVDRLLDRAYLDRLAAAVDLEHTREPLAYGTTEPAPEDGGTSHLCVIDGAGMAVACTQTINLAYGSLMTVRSFGFVLNNEMDDFTVVPGQPNAFGLRQSDRNLPQPGKRPLSSMSPTIVLDGERVTIVAGGSGGPRIITGTLQCLLNGMLFDMGAEEAVAAPRFHHQWVPEVLELEQAWTDMSVREPLEARGHQVAPSEDDCVIQLIRVNPASLEAASDTRKGGRPAGY